MNSHTRSVVLAVAMVLTFPPFGLTLLAHLTDDFYVRESDLIIVGDVASIGMHGQVPVAEVRAVEILMGSVPASPTYIRNFPDGAEDMPYFRVGERSLLFLRADFPSPGVFWCVGAEATKRDRSSYDVESWATMLDRVGHLVSVRGEADDRARTAALVRLLDSEDLELVAAASNYLNYLHTGQDREGWIIHPPEDSSDWSWRDYFDRNAIAHRKIWQAWWQVQQPTPQ
jgi:hypothetical protein